MKVALIQSYFGTHVNVAHFASVEAALAAKVRFKPDKVHLAPARNGEDYEVIPYGDWHEWARSEPCN